MVAEVAVAVDALLEDRLPPPELVGFVVTLRPPPPRLTVHATETQGRLKTRTHPSRSFDPMWRTQTATAGPRWVVRKQTRTFTSELVARRWTWSAVVEGAGA